MEEHPGRRALHSSVACPNCVRKARRTARFDWFGRVELLTRGSPTGTVSAGEIVVVDRRRGQLLTGIYATRKVCLHVPAFLVFGLLPQVPFVWKAVDRHGAGCRGRVCTLPAVASDNAARGRIPHITSRCQGAKGLVSAESWP